MTLRSHALSDIGRVRAENEDSFLCDPAAGLYGVADGIGGLPAGAQASQATIAAIAEIFARPETAAKPDYAAILEEINERVFHLGRTLSSRMGIGTTLTYGHVSDQKLHVTHVGDSLLLRVRGGAIQQLTSEHNIENEVRQRIARGESVGLVLENRLALTRCVGQPPPLEGEHLEFALQKGDRYLFCSDGITRMLPVRDIAARLVGCDGPEAWVKALVDLANERGGYDNSTAVALFVD
jgi:serine/threonine protein phosphatase PrpC